MFSRYPEAYDDFQLSTNVQSLHALQNEQQAESDAINKIQRELGLNPSGSYGSVAARLDAGQTFSGFRGTANSGTLNNGDNIPWTVVYDLENYKNSIATPTQLVIPSAGYYRVEFNFIDNGGSKLTGINCFIEHGVEFVLITAMAGAASYRSSLGSTTLHAVAGDTVRVEYVGSTIASGYDAAVAISRVGV